jgi:hypothetical protein
MKQPLVLGLPITAVSLNVQNTVANGAKTQGNVALQYRIAAISRNVQNTVANGAKTQGNVALQCLLTVRPC